MPDWKLEKPEKGSDKLIVRGTIHAAVSAWEREIDRLSDVIRGRRCFGELHYKGQPSDSRIRLQRVSHVITDLTINDSEIRCEAEILDTPNGRKLRNLIESGSNVTVSSRAFGTKQEDFQLTTFDFVADCQERDMIETNLSKAHREAIAYHDKIRRDAHRKKWMRLRVLCDDILDGSKSTSEFEALEAELVNDEHGERCTCELARKILWAIDAERKDQAVSVVNELIDVMAVSMNDRNGPAETVEKILARLKEIVDR